MKKAHKIQNVYEASQQVGGGWARGTGDVEAKLEDADPTPAPTPTKGQIGAESESQPASSKHRTAVRGEGRGLLDGARRFPSCPADEKRPESGISKKIGASNV